MLRIAAFALIAALIFPAASFAQANIIVDSTANKGAPVVATPPAAKPPVTAPAPAALVPLKDPENALLLDTSYGRVVISLRPDLAPKSVARLKELTRRHFYDGLLFHRVIDGFMAQTGDPKGDGTGGSGQKLQAEFSHEHFARGTVGMARAADPDSADSQFFICTGDSGFLDGQYTVVGQVTSGMEFIDQLRKGPRANNGMVDHPDKIIKMQVAGDAKS